MRKPLRFCMLTSFYPPASFGGDGIFVRNLARELVHRGHEVTVVHCVDSYRILAGHEPPRNVNSDPDIETIGLKSRFGFLSPLITQQTGWPGIKSAAIASVLKRKFDVVNFHNISLLGGPGLLVRAAELSDAVKLYTLHEYWLVCPTHTLFKNQERPCDKPQCLRCVLSYRRPPQLWRHTGLVRRAVRHVDSFITQDRFTSKKHAELGLNLSTRYIPHFVPFDPDEPGPASDDLPLEARKQGYFLFVGRLERLKGLQTLIPLFRQAQGMRLLIAGQGSFERDLRRQAEGLTNVAFLGHQNRKALRALYRQAIALLVPSINYEVAPPLVIREAFREGTPVIVRNLGANPEPVQDSKGGIIYENDSELLQAIQTVQADRVYRDMLGARGRYTLEREWSPSAYLSRYFALIEELQMRRSASA